MAFEALRVRRHSFDHHHDSCPPIATRRCGASGANGTARGEAAKTAEPRDALPEPVVFLPIPSKAAAFQGHR